MMQFFRKCRWIRTLSVFLTLWMVGASSSGCATGGYRFTVTYSRWLHAQPLLLRVVLYILIGWVAFVTALIDVLVNNVIDFWSGKVTTASLDQKFEKNGYMIAAHHERSPLRKSVFDISPIDPNSKEGKHQVVFQEKQDGSIEVLQDGKLMMSAGSFEEGKVMLTAVAEQIHGGSQEVSLQTSVEELKADQDGSKHLQKMWSMVHSESPTRLAQVK